MVNPEPCVLKYNNLLAVEYVEYDSSKSYTEIPYTNELDSIIIITESAMGR